MIRCCREAFTSSKLHSVSRQAITFLPLVLLFAASSVGGDSPSANDRSGEFARGPANPPGVNTDRNRRAASRISVAFSSPVGLFGAPPICGTGSPDDVARDMREAVAAGKIPDPRHRVLPQVRHSQLDFLRNRQKCEAARSGRLYCCAKQSEFRVGNASRIGLHNAATQGYLRKAARNKK